MTTEIPPAGWLTLPDVADLLGLPILKVRQLLKDGAILAVRRDGVLRVPSELLAGPLVIKHLPGVLNVLRDAGYNDEEALRWLYTPDETLGGTPAEALNHRSTEVKRRAQAMGF
nr:Rv2175c family DNA-binding protein [Longispora albida]